MDGAGGTAKDIQQQAGVVEIVGTSALPDRTGVYWLLNEAGETVISVNLPCPEGHLNGAQALNGQGAIVGWQSITGVDNSGRPVIWGDFASNPLELPVPDGFVGNALASDVNDNMLVVGNLTSSNGEHNIAAWQVVDVEGDLVAMDPIVVATGTQSGAARLNNQGFVAATLDYRAFRWQVDWNPDLGELGGLEVSSQEQLFDAFSYAADINAAGTVCGEVSGLWRWTCGLRKDTGRQPARTSAAQCQHPKTADSECRRHGHQRRGTSDWHR